LCLDEQFTKSAGLSFDASGLLGGTRSQRYAAIVHNGVVEHIFVEDEAPSVTVTSAEKVLASIA
jgi:peroxiredoxin